ncbi:period circadian protein isoform X4 [Nilaparvata lugens]|uniref:period circadian protein isoform X4 n=1 Tax=Nilaparvata lugens TaxID=108931 RepID=UPI00193E08D9|nr:period circadian protein isoform X4 [Nilaparvata lugens]
MSVLTSEARPGSPMETKDCERSDMDDTVTHNTKASDSGYSNSCSNNSQSQRSGSSKSRTSGSSSGSSGYSGHPPSAGNSHESSFQRPSATKRKDHKKKKLKVLSAELINDNDGVAASCPTNSMESIALKSPTSSNMGLESAILTSSTIQNNEIESHQMNSLSLNPMGHDHMKKLKGAEVNAVENFEEAASAPNTKEPKAPSLRLLEDLRIAHPKEQFMVVVSMQEGSVLYTTSNMTNVLGYPKDMWMGRSLFDFIHPKDRDALNKYITSCIAGPLGNRHSQKDVHASSSGGVSKQSVNTFHCCLRQYRGLKSSGFSVIEKKVDYLPCKISFFFHELNHNKLASCTSASASAAPGANGPNKAPAAAPTDGICDTLLIANASLIHSAYLDADEECCSPTFVTQHSTSMCLTHVDNQVIPYLGYMPHDMVGRSVFDFYHPDDLPYLKEVYKNVLKDKSQPYRGGKPYRFRTQNGTYALVETDWCGFVNPWTKKLEFIIGQHRIVKGPPQPDVTKVVEQDCSSMSEEVVKQSNEIREEIVKILNDTETSTDEAKMKISKCGKEIITYMEKFFDEEKTSQCKSLPLSFFLSFSQDRDSVMLGEISPHHEYCDSKSSSETPPSYNQLNYNDNIERFFESKPKTTRSNESNGQNSTERNTPPESNGEEEGGKLSPTEEMNCSRNSCLNNGSGGSSDLSFGSTGNVENSSNENENNSGENGSYRTPHLTEELLYRHNENMEKKMVEKHRERSKTDRELKLKDSRLKKSYEKLMEAQGSHGVKRSGSHSWEGEPYKAMKQTCTEQPSTTAIYYPGESTSAATTTPTPVSVTTNVNLWPPFSVTVTPMHSTAACQSHLNYTTNLSNPMMPFYYIQPEMPSNVANPPNQSKGSLPSYIHTPSPYVSSQVQYLGSMMYHPIAMPMFGAAPLMFSPLTMLPAPLVPTQPMKPQPKTNKPPSNHQSIPPCTKPIQRPSSQATSAKAEPGSALCSITSNSLQQALSDMSRREMKSMCNSSASLMSHDSSASMQKKVGLHNNSNLHENTHNDSSSYYSSFYSYMKTDEKSDESMKSLTENESSSDANNDGKQESVWKRAFANIDCNTSEEQMDRHTRKVITNAVNERKRSYKMMSQNDELHEKFEPPWSRDVALTPDIIFKYQVSDHVLAEVLENDLKILAEINQPLMVNEQLCQLYLDLDSFSQNDCSLETSLGFTSSSGSSAEGEESSAAKQLKKKKKRITNYDKMGMMFEENAPMPPPLQTSQLSCTTAA